MRFTRMATRGLALAVLAGAWLGGGSAFARGHAVGDLDRFMTPEQIYAELVANPHVAPAKLPFKVGTDESPYALPLDGKDLPKVPDARLASLVPEHLLPYFDLYLYVNKAESGLWAQQMFVYEKADGKAGGAMAAGLNGQRFELKHRWLVSTGLNLESKPWTITPVGLFQLDPRRIRSRFYSSHTGISMPYAMFLEYRYRHRLGGYAVHAVVPQFEKLLGRRASAGCIRLHYPLAEKLQKMVRARFAGQVPKFPFDEEEGVTSHDGRLTKDADGNVMMRKGYRVLIVIDGTPGEAPVADAPIADAQRPSHGG